MNRSPVVLRRAVPDDAAAVVDLHHACWVEAYSELMPRGTIERVFADREAMVTRRRTALADAARPMHLAVAGDALVGFASAGPPRHDDAPADLELYAIYARASVWGRGVGAALLAAAVGERPAYLWVLEGNDRAVGFYRRHGFTADDATEDHPEGRHLRMVCGVGGGVSPDPAPPHR